MNREVVAVDAEALPAAKGAPVRAVVLLSGGLDSTLALRLILAQGIEVRALNFVTVFCRCTTRDVGCSAARRAVEGLGVDLKTVTLADEYLEIVRRPPHGYGKNLNPCLDCRILMLRKAAEYMGEVGASFIVTGEVLGQRPMSQRRDAMHLIEREAGVKGLVVRPLCAQVLEPSIPEERGWVDRTRLLAFHGRTRTPQMALAQELGVNDYPCPAGGCLLTDPAFAARLRDLMAHRPDFGLNDVKLLKVGRHFRLSPAVKAVVGRNEEDNIAITVLARPGDVLLEAADVAGPVTLLRGPAGDGELATAAALTARYGDAKTEASVPVTCRRDGKEWALTVAPAADHLCDQLRVGA